MIRRVTRVVSVIHRSAEVDWRGGFIHAHLIQQVVQRIAASYHVFDLAVHFHAVLNDLR